MTDRPPPLPILAHGKTWLVIDKPAGLAVHPGPRTPKSLEDLLPALALHGVVPHAVHRLDRDTSGCLLLARRPSALRTLSRAFAAGTVEKRYWALVGGQFAGDEGQIDAPLAKRSSRIGGWRMVADAHGQPALTRWRRIGSAGPLALVEFSPRTGRTHQIRVHATLLGEKTALVGDPVYGQADPAGLMLHARTLGFAEPQTGERVEVVAPLPARFRLPGLTIPGLTTDGPVIDGPVIDSPVIDDPVIDSLANDAPAT
jgi:tRNA pseudouridine32 synthase/23S rRNA pseudouridine746 synthase